MTNYFCFVCQKYFLSDILLKEHAKHAAHANHDIGMTLYQSALPKGTEQCVCGSMFPNLQKKDEHIQQHKCYEKKGKQQRCVCGETQFKVFCQQGQPFYQCINCKKRNSFETIRESQTIPVEIEISNVDENNSTEETFPAIESKDDLMKMLENSRSTIEFAKKAGLLLETPICDVCEKEMVLCKQKNKSDGYVYSCYKYVFLLLLK